jgi:hypothetical protein
MDIILFVYKKTIFDTYDGENTDNSHTLSNIMTLTNETIAFDEKEGKQILFKITDLMSVLFHWSNSELTFFDRRDLCNKYLLRCLHKLDHVDTTLKYLEVIQENLSYLHVFFILLKLIKYLKLMKNYLQLLKYHASLH